MTIIIYNQPRYSASGRADGSSNSAVSRQTRNTLHTTRDGQCAVRPIEVRASTTRGCAKNNINHLCGAVCVSPVSFVCAVIPSFLDAGQLSYQQHLCGGDDGVLEEEQSDSRQERSEGDLRVARLFPPVGLGKTEQNKTKTKTPIKQKKANEDNKTSMYLVRSLMEARSTKKYTKGRTREQRGGPTGPGGQRHKKNKSRQHQHASISTTVVPRRRAWLYTLNEAC